jgi:flagellar motility protein MotE (MotC chaperone)
VALYLQILQKQSDKRQKDIDALEEQIKLASQNREKDLEKSCEKMRKNMGYMRKTCSWGF